MNNAVINSCFLMLFKDLIKLYACYNDGIINLLGSPSAPLLLDLMKHTFRQRSGDNNNNNNTLVSFVFQRNSSR